MNDSKDLIRFKDSTKLNDLKSKLHALTNKSNDSEATFFNPAKLHEYCILMDISGSMNRVLNSGDFAYTKMIKEVSNLVKTHKFDLFAFSDYCFKIFHSKLNQLYPQAGTNLTDALETVKQHKKSKVILLTDGEPNDQNSALYAARGLILEIIFIGNPPEPKFLKALAAQSGGSFSSVDLNDNKQLENKIRGLLT